MYERTTKRCYDRAFVTFGHQANQGAVFKPLMTILFASVIQLWVAAKCALAHHAAIRDAHGTCSSPIVCATQRRCRAPPHTRARARARTHTHTHTRSRHCRLSPPRRARAVGCHRLLCSICSSVYDCSGRIGYAVALGAVSIFFCLALLILAKVNNSVDGQIFKARLSRVLHFAAILAQTMYTCHATHACHTANARVS